MTKLFKSKKLFSRQSGAKSATSSSSKTSVKTKIYNRIGHWNFRKIARYSFAFGMVILLITSYFWYTRLYMTPERRFWAALDNSMSTSSVVRTLTQGGSGNEVVQDYRFHFAPQRVVENRVIYTEKSSTTDTSVTTEGVIFPEEQFLRYTAFTNSRTDDEQNSNIDAVLGKWAVQSSENPEEAKLNYLSEQVSLVIIGNYSSAFRNEMIQDMQQKQLYGPNLSTPVEDKLNDEAVYVYTISVKLKNYAELLNKAFVEAGYGEFPALDPDNYREDSAVNGNIFVRKKDNAVVGINFGGREERYGNYGVVKQIDKPEVSLTVEELQTQVQQLLQQP